MPPERIQFRLGRWRLLLTFLLSIVFAQTISAQQYFYDVPSNVPYFKTVNRMYELGFTNGCWPPGYYCPGDPALRSQMAVFVIRALYGGDNFTCPTCPPNGYFTDVPPTHWAFKWIQQMRYLNITGGCNIEHTLYCPEDNASFLQAAIFSIRASQLKPGNPNYLGYVNDYFTDYSPEAYFPDDQPSGSGNFNFVQKVRDQGTISTACGELKFCPNQAISRGEASYYIIRGIVGELAAVRKISQNAGSGDVWEPSIARGSTTWVAGWIEIPSNPFLSTVAKVSAWDPNLKRWGAPISVASGVSSATDIYITWDPYRGRFVFSVLDSGFRDVWVGYSTDSNGQSWSPQLSHALELVSDPNTNTYLTWDFPSVAVDSNGRVIVEATNTNSSGQIGPYTSQSTDGGVTFPDSRNPKRVPTAARYGRIAAVTDRFHVFSVDANPPAFTPTTLSRFESTDGNTWNLAQILSPNLGQPPNNSSWESACTPGQSSNCEAVFYGPLLDAKGDPGSSHWSVVAPMKYLPPPNLPYPNDGPPADGSVRTNTFICTDTLCGYANLYPVDEFMATTATSSDGSYWLSHLTYTPCHLPPGYLKCTTDEPNAASNLLNQTIRILPGWSSAEGVNTSSGTAPVRWRNTNSGQRCLNQQCYAAGDYASMAANSATAGSPLIQQSPSLRNDLFAIFSLDASGSGQTAFYAPYAVHPATDDLEFAAQIAAANPAISTQAAFDPPALFPVQPIPTNTFRPNFVSVPVGLDRGPFSPTPPSAYGVSPLARPPIPSAATSQIQ